MARAGEYFLESLRGVLHALNVNTVVQVSSGLSKHGFRALDVVTKLMEWERPVPRHSAWDLAYTHLYPHKRVIPSPEMWWVCMVRVANGMQDNWADWHMTDLNALNGLCVRYQNDGPRELQTLAMGFHHDRAGGYKVLTAMHTLLSGHMAVSPAQLAPLNELLHRLQTPILHRSIADASVQDALRRFRPKARM